MYVCTIKTKQKNTQTKQQSRKIALFKKQFHSLLQKTKKNKTQ